MISDAFAEVSGMFAFMGLLSGLMILTFEESDNMHYACIWTSTVSFTAALLSGIVALIFKLAT